MLVALAHAVLLHRDGIEGNDLAARLERASQACSHPVAAQHHLGAWILLCNHLL